MSVRQAVLPWRLRIGDVAALAPLAIGMVVAVDYFDNALFTFFSSYIAGGISASPEELVWASSAYALGAVLGILQQHAWVERMGYRRYLAICMAAFAIGGVAAALCNNPMQLTLARTAQGYFVGPMLGACRILIQVGMAPKQRPKALQTFMVLIVFGGVLAPIVGALLISHFDWRWLFACTAPVAAGTALLVWWSVPDIGDVAPEQRTEPHHLAYMVFALAQAALQVALTRARFELFGGSPLLIGLAIAGAAGLGWFVLQQSRHPAPLLQLSALRHATFQAGLALYVVYYYLSTAFSYLLPRLMEGGLDFSVISTGYFTGITSLATALLLFVYLRHSGRITRKKWLIVLGFGIAAVTAWWFAQMSPQAGREALALPLMLRGLLIMCIVLPVANLTFKPFEAAEFMHGYRLKNIVRQFAISFATSNVIAVQRHRLALHETRLSESASAANSTFTQALDMLSRGFVATGHSPSESHAMALGMLWRSMQQQATFMASLDGFEVLAVVAVAAGVFAAWQKRIA